MKTRADIEAEIVRLFELAEDTFDTMMDCHDDDSLALHYQTTIDRSLYTIYGLLWVLGLQSDDIPQVGSHQPLDIQRTEHV